MASRAPRSTCTIWSCRRRAPAEAPATSPPRRTRTCPRSSGSSAPSLSSGARRPRASWAASSTRAARIALGLLAESETRLRSELQRYGLKKAPAQDGSYGNQGPAGVDVTALHAVLQRRSPAMVPSPRHASRVDSSASAAPDLTSSRPATYYDCRTRARYFRRQRQTCEPSSFEATDETAGAGEVQANAELGFDRAGHT